MPPISRFDPDKQAKRHASAIPSMMTLLADHIRGLHRSTRSRLVGGWLVILPLISTPGRASAMPPSSTESFDEPESEISTTTDGSDALNHNDASIDDTHRTIVVTATRTEQTISDSPIATQVQTRDDIVDSGAENVAELLEAVPGVILTRSFGGIGLSLQGLSPSYTVILVDGQRTTGRVDGVLDLSRFPAEDIEQVEIVRGPGSVLYGADALAGVVNLRTRTPQRWLESEIHGAYGSFNTIDLTGRLATRHRWYAGSIAGGWHSTDGWDLDPSTVATNGPQQNQWHIDSRHDLDPVGPFSLTVHGNYLRRDSHLVDETETGAVFDRHNLSEVVMASVSPALEWSKTRLRVTASYNLFRDQFLQDQRGSTELDQAQDTFDHLVQTNAQFDHTLLNHTVTAGADGQLEWLDTQRIDPPRVDRQRYATFLQDEWRPSQSPKISLLLGARLDYDSLFGIYPTPRIALMVQPNQKWTFRTSYGRGYRAPSFREMYLLFANPSAGYTVSGNPQLEPETSWSLAISATYQPWRWASLSVNVFDNRLKNTIVINTAGIDNDMLSLFGYANVGEATTRGLEATASVVVRQMLRIEGSYTFVDTFDHQERRALPGRPRHSGTAGLRFHRPAWGTTIRLRSSIIGERQFFSDTDDDGIDETTTSSPFATLDARVAQKLFGHLELFVGGENLLNAGNPDDNPLSPRSFYGGATFRY